MANPKLAEARKHQAALKEIFVRHVGETADYRALHRVLALCQAAAETVDDVYCRDKLRLVGEYAAEMFVHSEHAKWASNSMPGMEFLRLQVLNALELYLSRLYSLEVIQRAQAKSREPA
jgi:hypothetical protein